jgi:hypothetical protein
MLPGAENCTVGVFGVAPTPIVTEGAARVIDPQGVVIVLVAVLAVVGVPVIGTVTTVALVRVAVPAVNPGGRFVIAKSDCVIGLGNVLSVSVNVIFAPLTA